MPKTAGKRERMANQMAMEQAEQDAATGKFRQIVNRYGPVVAGGKMTIGLGIAAVLSGVATYLAITEAYPFPITPQVVLGFLLLDLVLLLALTALIAWRLVALWIARRSGTAGARLHVRLVAMFALVAITPTIIMAVYSTLTINLGFQAWFGERISRVISSSVSVAESYVEEHKRVIRGDILAMANDITRARALYYQSPTRFSEIMTQQARLRSLSDAYLITSQGEILAQSRMSFTLNFIEPPAAAIRQAQEGDVILLTSERDSQVWALFKIDQFLDGFLYVSRYVDPQVLNTAMQARRAARDYAAMEGERGSIQIAFALIYLVLALLVLLAAIALGFWLANRLVEPIGRLVVAAEKVSAGDLTARVTEIGNADEVGALSRAFNRMTSQLEGQRQELVGANQLLDRRRRFTEAILQGVTSGVIGLDDTGNVNLANNAALNMLGTRGEELSGMKLVDIVPQMQPLVRDAANRPGRMVEDELEIPVLGEKRMLLVKVVKIKGAGSEQPLLDAPIPAENIVTDHVQPEITTPQERSGFVVTLEDITELVSAQRMAAWADVARRIAHEIKNPLTPIQLSAERLRRKYRPQIQTDPETFDRCTDTIIRQVRDIGHLVGEFSAFARMPAPVLKPENLVEIVRQTVFQQQLTDTEIDIVLQQTTGNIPILCDRAQITQAFTNIIKNAREAIESKRENEMFRGRIEISFSAIQDGRVRVAVADNGCGLPNEIRARLTEPYVTTRDRGTGLGLAIVRKIADDHGVRIRLADLPEDGNDIAPDAISGALIELEFPVMTGTERGRHHNEIAAESDMSAQNTTDKTSEQEADVA